MFERYTESARRAVFFARYEACVASAQEISTIDLLRGIVRESKPEAQGIEWIRVVNKDQLCSALWKPESGKRQGESPSAEIKLSGNAKLALAYAAEVARDNPRGTIDASTLLLGILSFQNEASQLLEQLGLNLESARSEVRQLHKKYPPKLPSWYALGWGTLRRHRMAWLKILIFLIVMFVGVALVNWLNR